MQGLAQHTKLQQLTRTIFMFGVVGRAPHGWLTLSPNGRICGYQHPMEYSYHYEDGVLSFLSAEGAVTSSFTESNAHPFLFLPGDVGQHALEPVFTLGPLTVPEDATKRDLPPVFVNTMAKAGTYLIAEALRLVGYRPLDLHLSSNFFHDNRGVSAEHMHWNPDTRRTNCIASTVATLIRSGEFAVGHVDDLQQLRKLNELDIEVVNAIRHPYGQLRSMMTFRGSKTKPKPKDLIWQSMIGLDQFKAFLMMHPIEYWLNFSRQITDNFCFVRFEDLRQGVVPEGAVSPRLKKLLAEGLKKAIGTKTSTYMEGQREGEDSYFLDPVVARYLEMVGAKHYGDTFWPEGPHHF